VSAERVPEYDNLIRRRIWRGVGIAVAAGLFFGGIVTFRRDPPAPKPRSDPSATPSALTEVSPSPAPQKTPTASEASCAQLRGVVLEAIEAAHDALTSVRCTTNAELGGLQVDFETDTTAGRHRIGALTLLDTRVANEHTIRNQKGVAVSGYGLLRDYLARDGVQSFSVVRSSDGEILEGGCTNASAELGLSTGSNPGMRIRLDASPGFVVPNAFGPDRCGGMDDLAYAAATAVGSR